MKKIILFIAVAALLFGCSTQKVNIPTDYNKENGEGMIVGTICIENKNYSEYTFVYCDDIPAVADYPNEKDKFSLQYAMPHFVVDKKAYFLFSIPKPVGKYKFYKVHVFDTTNQEVKQFDVPMNTKFEVVKGKTTYLGQINVNIKTKDSDFSVSDQADRDRAWFAEKVPQIQF